MDFICCENEVADLILGEIKVLNFDCSKRKLNYLPYCKI